MNFFKNNLQKQNNYLYDHYFFLLLLEFRNDLKNKASLYFSTYHFAFIPGPFHSLSPRHRLSNSSRYRPDPNPIGAPLFVVYRPLPWDQSYVTWNNRNYNTLWTNKGGDWFDRNNSAQGNTPYASITFDASALPDNSSKWSNASQRCDVNTDGVVDIYDVMRVSVKV